jgi:uncharacterized protein
MFLPTDSVEEPNFFYYIVASLLKKAGHMNKVDTRAEIITRILQEREQLVALGVLEIGLFGSFAREEQKPSSDVDILVTFRPGQHTFDNFMDVSFLLEEVLGRTVDVFTPEGLSPYIGPHILKEVQRVSVAA